MSRVPVWFDRLPHHIIERGIITVTFLLVVLLVVPTIVGMVNAPTVALAQRPLPLRVTCAMFATQAIAQAYFRAHPDETRLDSDHDGIACEDNHVPRDLTPVVGK